MPILSANFSITPWRFAIRHCRDILKKTGDPFLALGRAAILLEDSANILTFGTEWVQNPSPESDGESGLYYLNTGDTYALTIGIEESHGIIHPVPFFTSLGDWIEKKESEYTEASGMIRCGYCGEWTKGRLPSNPFAFLRCSNCKNEV